jgi:cytochrome c5
MRAFLVSLAAPFLLAALPPAPASAQDAKAEEKKPEEKKEGGKREPSFARDVAPMFAASCLNCHNPKARNWDQHKLDLTTFAGMMKGADGAPIFEAKKSDESGLIARLRGDGVRRMPPGGGNNRIGEEKIKAVAEWIDAGGLLDSGKDTSAPIGSYALTAEQAQQEDLGKMTPEQKTELAMKAGKALYAASNAKEEAESTPSVHFILFGKLPEPRVKSTLEALEREYTALQGLFKRQGAAPVIDPTIKISVLVFNESQPYAEFLQSKVNQKYEDGKNATGKLDGAEPFLAAIDPLAGNPEPEKPKGRRKKADASTGPERSLAGLLAEQLGQAMAAKAGKLPRYMTLGIGALSSARVDVGSPYVTRLRRTVVDQWRLGWEAKANEALGSEGEEETIRAMGFSLLEWMASAPPIRARMPYFIYGLQSQGERELDKVIGQVFAMKREPFYGAWGSFVMSRYGRLAR